MESDTEERIAAAFQHGQPVVLCDADGPAGRLVRAEFLTSLLLDGPKSPSVEARHALRLDGAHIVGEFDLTGTSVSAPLTFSNCAFMGRPVLEDATLSSLRMPGTACLGMAATNLTVRGNLELNDGFTSTGEVTLLGAKVEGDVRMAKATLRNLAEDGDDDEKGIALRASRLGVRGAFLAKKLDAWGQLRFISARIDSVFSLSGATLYNPGRIAFHGERLEVGESLLLQKGFVADGRVLLQNAGVKGGITATAATIRGGSAEEPCLQLLRGTVGRDVTLRAAVIERSVSVRSAAVSGGITFAGARFQDPESEVDASRLRGPWLNLRFDQPPHTVNLRHARLETIEDAVASWPARLELDGCEYVTLDGAADGAVTGEQERDASVEERLGWLDRGRSRFRPFPYDQLQAAYRVAGDEQSAARVGLAKQRRRRTTLTWPGRLLGYVYDATVGYGYRNGWAGAWMFALIVLAAVFFASHRPAAKPEAPEFQALVYAADLLLPIIDLGQATAYVAQGTGRFVAWGLILAGWVLTTAVVAGFSRLFNRSS